MHRIHGGHTTPGKTGWRSYEGENPGTNYSGVFVHVDTSAACFSKTPVYVCSIGGDSEMWATTGGSAVYSATKSEFVVFVRCSEHENNDPTKPMKSITPRQAEAWKWHINWIGYEA